VFCTLGLGLGKWQWRLSSGQKSCGSAGIHTTKLVCFWKLYKLP